MTRGKAAAVGGGGGAWKEDGSPPLKFPGFLVAGLADADGVVPAPRGHGAALRRAVVAHALAAGTAVVLGQPGGEVALAAVATQDVLVRNPVGWTGSVFHQACSSGGRAQTHQLAVQSARLGKVKNCGRAVQTSQWPVSELCRTEEKF